MLTDTAQIAPTNNLRCLRFWCLEFNDSQFSQQLTILAISWSAIGQFPPSPPGDYHLQTQAKISVPQSAPPPQACTAVLISEYLLYELKCLASQHWMLFHNYEKKAGFINNHGKTDENTISFFILIFHHISCLAHLNKSR